MAAFCACPADAFLDSPFVMGAFGLECPAAAIPCVLDTDALLLFPSFIMTVLCLALCPAAP